MWLKRTFRLGRYCLVWAVLALSLVWVLAAASAHAAMPVAGDSITNIAGGAYLYKAREIRTNSNAVITQVAEKSGVVLTDGDEKLVMPGATVYFPHVLTNTGNAADGYTLQVYGLGGGGVASFESTCQIFADDDEDGRPDSTEPLKAGDCTAAGVSYAMPASFKLASDASYHFVVAVKAKATGTAAGHQVALTVKAASLRDNTVVTNGKIDKATIVTGDKGFFEVIKTVDKSSAAQGEVLTYTFRITNYGAAGGTTITDEIGKASDTTAAPKWDTTNLSYDPGSGKWTGVGNLTDDVGNSESADTTRRPVLKYSAVLDTGTNVTNVKIELAEVQPATPQIITFRVKVKDAATVGGAHSKNMANYIVTGAAAATGECQPPGTDCRYNDTNSATTTVKPKYKVVLNGADPPSSLAGIDGTAGTPNATVDDTARLENPGDAIPGGRLRFKSSVWNNGNAEDIVRLSVKDSNGRGTFPDKTAVVFFEEDGIRPLPFGLTPPIAPSKSFTFVTVVFLPSDAPAGGRDFEVDVIGTSTKDTSEPPSRDAVKIKLGALREAILEFAQKAEGTLTGSVAVVTKCALGSPSCDNAGGSMVGTTQAVFPLFVRSDVAHTFALSAAANADFTEAVDAAKWEVKFYEPATRGSCVDGGALKVKGQITKFDHDGNAGTDTMKRFFHAACAVVTQKPGAPIGTGEFYFRVRDDSPPYKQAKLRDQVVVPGKYSISLSPASVMGQVFKESPSVDYQYLLRNEGNAPLRCKFVPTITATTATAGRLGWTAVLRLDKGDAMAGTTAAVPAAADLVSFENGVIPAGAQYVGTGSGASAGGVLDARKELRLILKVTASPADLEQTSANVTDQREVTITPTNCEDGTPPPAAVKTVVTTTVIGGKLKVVLTQAAYPTCSNTPAGTPPLLANYSDQPLGRGTAGGGVKPGQCVCYRVVAKNMNTNTPGAAGAAGVEETTLTDVKVTNPIPAYTKLNAAAECTTTATGGVAAAGRELGNVGFTGELRCGVASLPAQESVEMKFCVKIDE